MVINITLDAFLIIALWFVLFIIVVVAGITIAIILLKEAIVSLKDFIRERKKKNV